MCELEKINGENIYLREMTEQDTDAIIMWRNQSFVREQFIFREFFTREIHHNWIRTMVETGKVKQFIIYVKETNQAIGSVYLRDIDRVNERAEYGVFIGEEAYLGKGIGKETAKLMLRYAFENLQLHKVRLRVLADNMRAIQSYQGVGFEKEGYFKDEVVINGQRCDLIFMAVIRDDERKAEFDE